MDTQALELYLLPGELAVCRLEPGETCPPWAEGPGLVAVVRAPDELTVICPAPRVPPGVERVGGWRALKVAGPLEMSAVGILAGLSGCLARAGVSLLALSTFLTDYLLVRQADLPQSLAALRAAGYRVVGESEELRRT